MKPDYVVGTYNIQFKINPVKPVQRLIRQTDVSVLGLQEIGTKEKKDDLRALAGWSLEAWTNIPGDPNGPDGLSNPIMYRNATWRKISTGWRKLHGPQHWGNDGGTTTYTDAKYVGWVLLENKQTSQRMRFSNLHMMPSATRIPNRARVFAAAVRNETGPVPEAVPERRGARRGLQRHARSLSAEALYNAGFTNIFRQMGIKRGTHAGNRAIDLVWYDKSKFTPRYAQILPNNDWPSDHAPVVVYLNTDKAAKVGGVSKTKPTGSTSSSSSSSSGSGSGGAGSSAPSNPRQADGSEADIADAAGTGSGGASYDSRFYASPYESIPVADRKFQFNPPLHRLSKPVRVDYSNSVAEPGEAEMERRAFTDWFDEKYIEKGGNRTYRTMRLGRIIQAETAIGTGNTRSLAGKYRWGFRFLYNPALLQTNTTQYNQILLNAGDEASILLSGVGQNFQMHGLSLLLNRIPDLEGELNKDEDYEPREGWQGLAKIRKWGTGWDLEYLYRIANGVWNTNDSGQSGNIGLIQPNPAYLILGPGIKHYGFIESIQYQHERFSRDMVPTLTTVTLTFRRSVHVTGDTWDDFVGGNPYASEPELKGNNASGGTTIPDDGSTSGGNVSDQAGTDLASLTADPSGTNGLVTRATDWMWDQVMAEWGDVIANSHCWRADGGRLRRPP